MSKTKYDYPIIVIGAGAGGLVVAIGAAKAGKKVLLIDRGTWGGDCSNFGCIPSKTLIASAHVAHHIRNSTDYGITASHNEFSTEEALKRVRRTVQHFVDHESPEALSTLGVNTLEGTASFVDQHTLKVSNKKNGDTYVSGSQIVIATGSHPITPTIKGLENTPYLNNESLFQLKAIPKRLAIIGGGAIGCEMAQCFQRLGSQVTLIEFFEHLLSNEEPEAKHVIEGQLQKEGVQLLLGRSTTSVSQKGGAIEICVQRNDSTETTSISVDHMLIATGRRPNIDSLNLEATGIDFNQREIKVNTYGQSSIPHIWAIGDVNGGPLLTHIAEMEARAVLTSLLLPWPLKKKFSTSQAIPRVTYTDPEVAAVGLTEAIAIEKYGESQLATYHIPFTEVDRAVCMGRTEGFIKVITRKWSSKILGATVVCPRGGEVMNQMATAMYAGLPFRKLRGLIHAYPTYGQGVRKAADLWLTQTLVPNLKKLIGK